MGDGRAKVEETARGSPSTTTLPSAAAAMRAANSLSALLSRRQPQLSHRWTACAPFVVIAVLAVALSVLAEHQRTMVIAISMAVLAGLGALAVLRMARVNEATIAAQRQLVDAGFETANAIVILRNQAGRLLQANAVAERVSGFSARELANEAIWRERFPTDDWDAEQSVEAQALHSTRPIFRESIWLSKSGDRRTIRWSNVALRYGADAPAILLKIGLDVTELRYHEASLQRNETHLRLAHRLVKLCHWHWLPHDPTRPFVPTRRSGRFIYSEEARDIFGYEPEELPAYGDEFAALIIHSDDRAEVFSQYKDFRARGLGSYSVEYRAVHKLGRVLYIRETAEWIIDEDRNVVQIVGTFQDVTDLRASERNLKLVQNELRRSLRISGLCYWSRQLSLDSVDGQPSIYQSSGNMAELLGLAEEDVTLDDEQWQQKIVHPEDTKSSWQRYQDFIQGPETSLVQEYRILSRYRGIRHVRSFCEKSVDAQGRVVEVAGALQDVTEQRQRELELIKAKNAAEIANRSKTEFLANMSHELRTPLNAVIGFSQVIRDRNFGNAPERYSAYAADIYKSGQLLLKLISDVLDMSKLEAGKVDLFEEIVDVAAIATDCLRMLQARADEGKVRIEQNWQHDMPPLFADARAVAQILLNVLTNAVKFSPPGRNIHLTGRVADGGECVVVIRDTGIGMSAGAMQNLFSAFHQADATISRRFGGTGLGLAITKRLMELHGGSIDLTSKTGQGTRVVLRFPESRVQKRSA